MCLFKKSVNGHIFRGKYRLVKPVSPKSMNTLRKEYEIQENNMLLLRHPYLSQVSVSWMTVVLYNATTNGRPLHRRSHMVTQRNWARWKPRLKCGTTAGLQ